MDKHIYGTTGTQIYFCGLPVQQIYSCGTNKYTFVGLVGLILNTFVGLTNILLLVLWD